LYAYINPVIAVALGVLLLNEPFDSRMATAAVLVFAGVAIVRLTDDARGAFVRAVEPAVAPRRAALGAGLLALLPAPAA